MMNARLIDKGENMNYRITVEFSVNDDEKRQKHPTRDQVIDWLYKGRIVPPKTLFNVTKLEVDVY